MPTTNVGPGSAQELQHIADIMGKSKKVVVITGAGISTNCGIPDFRSENGLYSLIQAQYDAALKDPSAYTEEIDDRPTKRRRVTDRWTYVTVKADTGEVVTDPSLVLPPPGASSESSSRSSRSQSRDPKSSDETSSATSNSSESEGPQKSSQRTRRSLRTQLSQEVSSDESVLTKPSSLQKNLPSNLRRCSERQTSSTRVGSPPPPPAPVSSQNSITPATQSSEEDPVGERIADNTKPKTDEFAIGLKLATGKSTNSSFEHSEFIKAEDKSPLNDPSPSYTAEKTQTQREESVVLNTQETETSFQASQSSQSSRTSLPNLKGKDLFDAMVWQDSFTTSVFYRFISSLRKKVYEDVTTTTESHKFIRTLYNGGRLVRTYTQNIDGLEEREGLCTDLEMGAGDRARFTSKRDQRTDAGQTGVNGEVGTSRRGDRPGGCQVVQLHGSLDVLRCGICQKTATWDLPERQSITLAGQAPDCPICEEQNARRTGRGRRSLAVGRLRPDIVLYGEEHPSAHLIGSIVTHDLGLGPDVLLIMGTSLRVHGLKVMVKEFAKAVHSKGGKVIFVNNTKPSESIWGDFIDFWIQWDCDSWVLDLKQRRKDLWLSPGELAEQKTKRQSTSERQNAAAKPTDTKRPYRPSATRDCKLNGAYITSKILQMLGSILGPDGRPAPRIEKLNSKLTVSITTQSKPKSDKRKSVAHTSSSSSARKVCKGKTRSSLLSRVGHESRPTLVTEIISKLRRNSDSGMFSKELLAREALASLSTNAGRPVATSYKDFHFTMQTNLLQGLTWPLKRMNLMTLPPNTTGTRMRSSVDIRGYKNDTYSSFSPVAKMAASRGTTEVAHSSREDDKLRLASLKSIGINTIQAPASAEVKMGTCDDARACKREFRHQTPVQESKATLPAPPNCNITNSENPSEDPTSNEDNLLLPKPRPNTRSRTSDATQLQDAVDAQLLLEAMAPKQRRPSGTSTSLPKDACIDCRQKKRRCLHVPSLHTPPASSDDCILANSDPLTPSTQRIKNMGKIGALLSSPARSLRSRRTGELRSGIE